MASGGEVEQLLSKFLRASRAKRMPADVDLPQARRRRVAGLRREEVARLAGVSVDYYTRLEQGRVPPPSNEVLDVLAETLGLGDAERSYLQELAAHRREVPAPGVESVVDRQTQTLIDCMAGAAAVVLDPAMNVLAWNALATHLFLDFGTLSPGECNVVRLLFLDERMRRLYVDWSATARVAASMLRMRAARFPHDKRISQLAEELSDRDPAFQHWWTAQEVTTHSVRRHAYRHPLVGDLETEWCEVISSVQPELTIIVLTPADAASRQKLTRLTAHTNETITTR